MSAQIRKITVGVCLMVSLLLPGQAMGAQSSGVNFLSGVSPFDQGLGVPLSAPSTIGTGSTSLTADGTHGFLDCSQTIGAEFCTETDVDSALLQMPLCVIPADTFCVKGLGLVLDNGDSYKSSPLKTLGQRPTPELVSLGLPSGGAAALWSAPATFASLGIDGFYVSVSEQFLRLQPRKKMVQWSTLATVIPYHQVDDPSQRPYQYIRSTINLNGNDVPSDVASYSSCPDSGLVVWVDTGACGMKVRFPANIKVQLAFRDSSESANWFHGRLFNPKVETAVIGSTRDVSVSGEPVEVPMVNGTVPISDWRNTISKALGQVSQNADIASWLVLDTHQSAVDQLNMLMPYALDTASNTQDIWAISSQNLVVGARDPSITKCIQKYSGFAGLVTSNSTAYTSGPPSMNPATKSIDYSVISPHYAPDGKTENLGKYSFLINMSVARCLYTFTNAPISASVSIHSSQGEEKVAVTSIQQKDDWLTVSADGFTYSKPTISIAMKQEVTNEASDHKVSTTVTCVKVANKKIKKVIKSRNPKCPRGFRLKG